MFCKICGKSVDPRSAVCPECNNPIVVSDGNGFWDLAGSSPAKKSVPVQMVPSRSESAEQNKKTDKRQGTVSRTLCVLCLGLVVIGGAFSWRTVNRVTRGYEAELSNQKQLYENELETLRSENESQMSEQKLAYENELETLRSENDLRFDEQKRLYEAEIENLSAENELLKTKLNERIAEEDTVEGIAGPNSRKRLSRLVGYKDREGSWLFGLQIQGGDVSFQWEKMDENGNSEMLEFDDRGINEKYGLMLDENIENGYSRLVAAGLTEESGGTYVCTGTNAYGVSSAEAELILITEKENSIPALVPEKIILQKEIDAPIKKEEGNAAIDPAENGFFKDLETDKAE